MSLSTSQYVPPSLTRIHPLVDSAQSSLRYSATMWLPDEWAIRWVREKSTEKLDGKPVAWVK